jgi:hypothetical protein
MAEYFTGTRKRESLYSDSDSDAYTIEFQVIRTRAIIRQRASRLLINHDYEAAFRSVSSMQNLRDDLYNTRSTEVELLRWLENHAEVNNTSDHVLDIPRGLFQIVLQDSLGLLESLHSALDSINIDVLDDARMEDRLGNWRQIITRAQQELPLIKESAAGFLEFVQSTLLDGGGLGSGFDDELRQLTVGIDDALQRL